MNGNVDNDERLLGEADECFIEALLHEALRPDTDGREKRIARVLKGIDGVDTTTTEIFRLSTHSSLGKHASRRWRSLAITAAAVVVVGLVLHSSQHQPAYAAVLRSLEAAIEAGPRRYKIVREVHRPFLGVVTVEGDLYVDGPKRFAIRHPARLPIGDLWIGGNERENWIVPPVGPVLVGDDKMLQGWLSRREELDSPLLHLATLLRRLSEQYRLETLPDEMLADPSADGVEVVCQHIRGVLRDASEGMPPQQIDLWADRETGIARRILLDWRLSDGAFGRSTITIELVGSLELPDDWFECAGHQDAQRAIWSRDRDLTTP